MRYGGSHTMTLSETVNRVIDLSGRISDYYEAELPKHHPNYPLIHPDDEEPPPPPEERQLHDFLHTLTPELIAQLLVLVSLAYGAVPLSDMAEAYEQCKTEFRDRERAISYLMAQAPNLVDTLERTQEKLSAQNLNLDCLPLKKAKVRKR